MAGGLLSTNGFGHVIKDSTTTYTQRNNLLFNNSTITDDSTNNTTIITPTTDNTPTLNSTNLITSGSVYDSLATETNARETEDTAIKTLMAPIETTSTASKAYVEGEQFVFNNQLVKATSAITLGDTIILNDNCTTVDNITKQINNLSSKVSGTYQYLGTRGILLATSDGNKTVRELLTEAADILKTKNVSSMYPGADRVRVRNFQFPYGNATESTITMYQSNYGGLLDTSIISNISSMEFTRISAALNINTLTLFYVVMASTDNSNINSTCLYQKLTETSVSDFSSNKPLSNLNITIAFDFYRYSN